MRRVARQTSARGSFKGGRYTLDTEPPPGSIIRLARDPLSRLPSPMRARRSEFGEKDFEIALYNQLGAGTRLVWSPDQVLEHEIGVDFGMHLEDPFRWAELGFYNPRVGLNLRRVAWLMRRNRRQMPNFRMNLFLQVKRCYYHRRPPNHLRPHMPAGRCWHFEVEEAQQLTLGRLVRKLSDRAVALYAAPAFHDALELNTHRIAGTLVANCTFPTVSCLDGHRSWYYSQPGGKGVANIDPTPIDGPGLEELIAAQTSGDNAVSYSADTSSIESLSARIVSTVSDELSNNEARKVIFFERLREVDRTAESFGNYSAAVRSFLSVSAFSEIFNLDWYVIGRNSA